MYSPYQSSAHTEEQCATSLKETFQLLNKDELQKLLDDDKKLSDMIHDMPQVRNFSDDKESLFASNKSIAEYNIGLQPRLAQEKAQLATTYKTMKELKEEFDQSKQKLESLSSHQELDTTLALLQTESAKAEESSEKTADTFLEGDMELEDFIQKYLPERTVAHTRKIKVEKLQEIIRNSQHGHGYTSNHPNLAKPSQPTSTPYNTTPGIPSYPMGNPAYNRPTWSTQSNMYDQVGYFGK